MLGWHTRAQKGIPGKMEVGREEGSEREELAGK